MGFSDSLPQVEAFFCCFATKTGSLIIGLLTVIYAVFHPWSMHKRVDDSSKIATVIKGLKILMSIVDLIFGIVSLMLIYGVIKDQPRKAKTWMSIALADVVMLIFYELFSSPFFYPSDDTLDNLIAKNDVWPSTIKYSMLAFVFIYFMIVVNSYYMENRNRKATGLCADIAPLPTEEPLATTKS